MKANSNTVPNLFRPLVGLEIEFHVIDLEGNVVNSADLILNHPDLRGFVVAELSKSIVEVLCEPQYDLVSLAKEVSQRVDAVRRVAAQYNLRLIPSTPISDEKLEKRKGARYNKKNVILGDEKRALELGICGTHIHIDKYDDIVKQYCLMTASDPAFGFMSSSSFYKNHNSLNNYRNKVYRKDVFEIHEDFGMLLPYVSSSDELVQRFDSLFVQWKSFLDVYNLSYEGFNSLNTCWGPVRLSSKTIESRSSDTNLLSNVLALAALHLGLHRQLPLMEKQNDSYVLNDFTLPSYDKLLEFQDLIIKNGLISDDVSSYLHQLISISKEGLDENEKIFLEPFENMLVEKKNYSDTITEYAKQSGEYHNSHISSKGAFVVRKTIANDFESDLDECISICE